MSNIVTIAIYELKMQVNRLGGWIVWLLVGALTAIDCWPTAHNYRRLSDLETPAYFINRILGQSGLLLLFGWMFLVAGRIALDAKSGTKELFMATPLKRASYMLGKWAGSLLYLILMMLAFLFIHTIAYALLNTAPFHWPDYALPIVAGILFIVLPSCFFMATCASLMPVWCDIRLCYFLLSALCMLNMLTFGSELDNPFFQLTFGVLSDQVYDNPFLPAPGAHLVASNVAFLLLVPIIVALAALLKRGFWRETK